MILFRAFNKIYPLQRNFNPFQSVNVICRLCSTKPLLEISDPAVMKYFECVKKEYWDLKTKSFINRREQNKLRELLPVVKVLEERSCVLDNLKSLEELQSEESKDEDMHDLMKEERETYDNILKELDNRLLNSLFEDNIRYGPSDTILEVTAGVGGQEAMLFAREVYEMYLGYAAHKRWECQVTQLEKTDIGGVRKACVVMSGVGTFENLQLEAGVHRVQRVPATERGGRLHTSTVSVAVMLQPTEIEVDISDRDIRVETKRSTGAGGQHVNTTDSAVRVVHLPTGVAVECQTERDQHKNKKTAMAKLRAILFQQQTDKQDSEERALRKSQIGSSLRNEKIRTYNYNQDRVTDHRVTGGGGTVHSLSLLMEGGAALDALISRVRSHIHTQNILQEIEVIRNAEKEKKFNKA